MVHRPRKGLRLCVEGRADNEVVKVRYKGRMWGWIFSFLSDRKGICKIGEFIGGEFTSCTGLPQGSVISPLLFNIFIMDMFCIHNPWKDKMQGCGNTMPDLAHFIQDNLKISIYLSMYKVNKSYWGSHQICR